MSKAEVFEYIDTLVTENMHMKDIIDDVADFFGSG